MRIFLSIVFYSCHTSIIQSCSCCIGISFLTFLLYLIPGNPRKVVPVEDLDEENVGGEGSLEVMEGVIEEDYVDDDDDYCKHLFIHSV